jgi:hypothetical protein
MATMEIPALIVRHILQYVYGEADSGLYDGDSWADTEANQRTAIANGFRWAIRFTPRRFSEFTRQVAEQSNADLFQSGGLWVYRWRTAGTPVATFTTDRNLLDLPRFTRTPPRTALAAKLKASWDANLGVPGEYRKSEIYTSTLVNQLSDSQVGRHTRTDEPTTFEMPFVWDAAMATWLARRKLARLDRQHWTVALATDWDALAVEKGDNILVTSSILQSSMGSPRGLFTVTEKRYEPGTNLISLTAEEVEGGSLDLLLTWSVRGLSFQVLDLTFTVLPRLTRPLTWAVLNGAASGSLLGAAMAEALAVGETTGLSIAFLGGTVSGRATAPGPAGYLVGTVRLDAASIATAIVQADLRPPSLLMGSMMAMATAVGTLGIVSPPMTEDAMLLLLNGMPT